MPAPRRPLIALVALLSALLSSADAQAPAPSSLAPQDVPELNIEEHVPPQWLRGNPDEFPLQPERWRRRVPRRCRTNGGYREHCQGDRRVPTPSGPAAEAAARLGLGNRLAARLLMHQRPPEPWIELVNTIDTNPQVNRQLRFPVPEGRLGRGFGRTRQGSLANRRHRGVDIGAEEGSDIVAARDGIVAYSGNELTGYGNVVILLHREGYTTLYAHCQETLVFAGQVVRAGTPIAKVGDTGFAWAPHLHFEWRQRGWPRDPAPHFLPRESNR